ncbi:MAG: DUF2147 domain-containing protein [Cytophagales bacterium]|nr:DUF2147 domain-containing protein [Cytophagales bacterium]
MKKYLSLLALVLSFSVAAQMTPVGTWHTVDDETGKPSGEIRISAKANGELAGSVVKSLLPSNENVEPLCTKCADDRKDQPKIGMEIIRGAKQTDGTHKWEGGTIIDPNNGKVYKLRLMPIEGGAKLQVRGYIGPFFRTQTWNRVN